MSLHRRCGLCDIEIPEGVSWTEHLESEEHKSKLPKHTEPPKWSDIYKTREVSEEERQRNKRDHKIAKIKANLGYTGLHGRSYHTFVCECGEIVDVYCWSGSKRCPNCWKILSLAVSHMEED